MGGGTGNASIVIDSDDLRFTCEEIKVVPLDGPVFESLGVERLDFIKADIEGHEDRFLAGAREVIRRWRPVIYLEINDFYYKRRGVDPTQSFEEWMDANSYRSVLWTHSGWKLSRLVNRKPGLDNVFFVPAERAEDLAGHIASEPKA